MLQKKREKERRRRIILFAAAVLVICVVAVAGIYRLVFSGKDDSDSDRTYTYSKIDETEESEEEEETDETVVETERSYAVSTSSDIATSVGMSVLESGGNAVDAAIAVAYTLGVVEPYGSGVGGSGGMLIYDMNTGECVFYDYRACAGSTEDSYDLIAVPGFVAGMQAVYDDYGTIDFADLIEPAIDYAENGFTITYSLSYRMSTAKGDLSQYSWFYDDTGTYLSTGGTFYQTELAEVLRAIQEEGSSVFYEGWIAEDIADATSLTLEDLASYEVIKREAVTGEYEGYTIYSASAPFSGVTLIQMLEMAEELGLADPEEDTLTYLSQLKQITATAYSSQYKNVVDPDYGDIDEEELVSEDYILSLLEEEIEDYEEDDESTDTTSFSIVDENGLVVVSINTLTEFWGSRIVVDGIYLNNTNDNFSTSGINQYEPGKRARTFTTPTILVGDDGYVLAVGTPGGSKIPARLFTVITDILTFGLEPQAAVDKMSVFYKSGVLTLELDDDGTTWIDTSEITESIVWQDTGSWWGCISLAGYSEDTGAFSAFDSRRGATMSGVYNP